MSFVCVRPATEADRPVLERLWLMFRHDMSEFTGALPDARGRYRDERLHAAFDDPDRIPYLLTRDGAPVGLAFVRGLSGPVRVLGSFFVVRAARRAGVGLLAVRRVVAAHPGLWEVAFQDANTAAVRFWRRVAADIAGDAWHEEHRPCPGRPDLPPDVWISFGTPDAVRQSGGAPGGPGDASGA